MMPKLPWWLILLVAPMAWWSRLRNNPFLLQVAASYAASTARVASWLVVSAVVYRWGGADQLAILMLVRGTIGILSYTSLGLTPALVQLLSQPNKHPAPASAPVSKTLGYAHAPEDSDADRAKNVFHTAMVITFLATAIGAGVVVFYAMNFHRVHAGASGHSVNVFAVVMLIGFAVLVRIAGDTFGAKLQAKRKIGRDSLTQVAGEAVFVAGAMSIAATPVEAASLGLLLGSAATLLLRAVQTLDREEISLDRFDPRTAWMLLSGGAFVMLAQLADWLYAPVNQILIARFLSVREVADYVPALQVDAAMLLLVSGLATVLLPYSARAMHVGNYTDLRLIYVGGTLLSLVILSISAVVICLIDGWLFQKWFGDPLPATQAILPLVMVHTVAGGSASIGRSVLFGMGRFKAYAVSAILGGGANVALAIIFLTTTSLGLRGIIYATIITVVVRCLIWMPVYTLWSIYKIGGPMRIRWH